MTLDESLLDAVKVRPGQSSTYYANIVGMDPSNCRRELKRLYHDGKLTGRRDGSGRQTILFWPANGGGQMALPGPVDPPSISWEPKPSTQPIEGTFREVATQSVAPGSPAPGPGLTTAEAPAWPAALAAIARAGPRTGHQRP
jgi:hypothetical protein